MSRKIPRIDVILYTHDVFNYSNLRSSPFLAIVSPPLNETESQQLDNSFVTR